MCTATRLISGADSHAKNSPTRVRGTRSMRSIFLVVPGADDRRGGGHVGTEGRVRVRLDEERGTGVLLVLLTPATVGTAAHAAHRGGRRGAGAADRALRVHQ